jgi:hypothetical protein
MIEKAKARNHQLAPEAWAAILNAIFPIRARRKKKRRAKKRLQKKTKSGRQLLN